MSSKTARIRASSKRLNQVIRQGAASFHSDILLNVDGDAGTVETLMQTNQRAVVSYVSWNAAAFDAVEGSAKAILPVGGTGNDQTGVLDYMDFVNKDSGTVEFAFEQDGDTDANYDDLATHWLAEGALNVRLRLPTSEDDLDAVPWDHPPRWTPDNEYASRACLDDDGTLPDDEDEWIVPPTTIETNAGTINDQIIGPAKLADGVAHRPITVEDGEFTVNVSGKQANDAISGAVNAESVEGPDVDRQFPADGFDDIFGVLSGPVALQTAPNDDDGVAPPMTVVQENSTHTVRHLIGALEA